MTKPNENKKSLKEKFYQSMFFDEFIKRDLFTNKGLLLGETKKVWAFNSGNTFTGNPKWLFIYINKYRKDIDAYWLCDNVETVDYVRSLGYKAYAFNAGGGIEVKNRAGVFVTEQVKEQIPAGMENAILLNLYHGVGCKTIERKVDSGFLVDRIMTKYIRHSNYYFSNMLFLVTSPLMEEHFMNQVGVDKDHIIKAGYPRCAYQQNFPKIATFNHNIIDKKKKNKDTRVVVYAPTYRDNAGVDLMNSAIPDMDALEKKLKKNNMLLIFKMHPFVVSDINYQNIMQKYENSPYFLFWDNNNDFYEVMDKVDIAVVDYSSIFYDFLAAGVKNYVRYFFDYDNPENLRDFAFDCKEMTCGRICNNFEEFLAVFDDIESTDSEEADRQRIYDLFWQYSDKDTFEKIINQTLEFEPKKTDAPTLYSFDIFDTIISRKGLHPHSIFYKIKEQLHNCGVTFPAHFIENFVEIRIKSEQNAREYYNKTMYVRKDNHREITLNEIIERMAVLYNFSTEQKKVLYNLECKAELDDCIPIKQEIDYVESLIDSGEEVVLISDMYLPKELIIKMLEKVSKKIAKLPLFLSSDYKVQKTTARLYFEVYKSFPFYKFGKWIHHGDNYLADKKMPEKLGIESVMHTPPKFSEYENALVSTIKKYDAYLIAAKMARKKAQNKNRKDYFCYSYASLTFVPYVVWAVKDAVAKGIDTLYFISRDGHHLKRIADKVIEKLGLDIKTKYIYGSRKVWRIPSFIDEFDESFFLPFGNVESATNFKKLLQALCLDKKTFLKIFPNLSYLKDKKSFNKKLRKTIISVLSASQEYKEYLLDFAKEKRKIIDEYFLQEMNFDEKFAFVEYWGRGYTQTCHTRLLQNVAKEKCDVPYYYMRSIYPTIGNDIRYNYTDCNASLIFVEALFANIDYKSIEEYDYDENGLVIPVKQKADCDMELFESMNKRLLEFTDDFLSIDFDDIDYLGRALLKFALEYFRDNPTDEVLLETIAPLIDAVGLFGEKREFAPALSKETVEKIVEKEVNPIDVTSSIPMSLARSDMEVQEHYHYLTVVKPAEEKEIKKGKKTKYSAKAIDFNNKLRMLGFKNIKQSNMRIYKQFLKHKVNDSAIFFGENNNSNENYISLTKTLKQQGFEIINLPLKDIYDFDELELIAKAKFLITDEANEFFALMNFRKQTKVIKLYSDTFPIERFGTQDIQYGKKSDLKLKSTIFNANCDCLPIASAKLFDRFNCSYNNAKKVLKPLGNPACDLYFDDEFINNAKQKIAKINKENKKVIVYLPNACESKKSTFDFIDLTALKERFCNDYILLVKTNDKALLESYKTADKDFVFALDENISIREAIVASDVVIGDYSSIVLESTLSKKPIILTGVYTSEKCEIMPDEILSNSGITTAYDTNDIIDLILSIDDFDENCYNDFIGEYLNSKESAKNIIKILKEV